MPQPEVIRKIVLKDLVINYRCWPTYNTGNPCILFLHGWQLSGEVWLPIVRYLFDRDYNIYAIDLPGFGRSEMPPADYNLGDYADLVLAFIKKMKMKNIIVVGHSFGGRVAIKLASETPQLFQKLVLADSAGLANKWAPWIRLKIFLAKIFRPAFRLPFIRMARIRVYEMIGAGDYITVADEMKQVFVNVINENLTPLLTKLKGIPTLIIWGEKDKETPVSMALKFRQLIPNSELVILKGAGHLSFFDQPLFFSHALGEFIGESDIFSE